MVKNINLEIVEITDVKRDKDVTLLWEKVEDCWPVSRGTGRISFTTIRQKMERFLIVREVYPQAFSHFGLVVNSIEASIEALSEPDRISSSVLKRDWVEAYAVYVARSTLEGRELEFIEPVGESFFYTFLKEEGEGLHHLAFHVNDIQNCLEKLKADKVELIDKEPRSGSHGKIAFLLPGLFGRMCIELCQKQK